MNRKNRVTKTNEQIKNGQLGTILGELEKDIEHFRVTVAIEQKTIN